MSQEKFVPPQKRKEGDSRIVNSDPDYDSLVTLENEAFAKGISHLAQMLNRSKELELNGRKKKKTERPEFFSR